MKTNNQTERNSEYRIIKIKLPEQEKLFNEIKLNHTGLQIVDTILDQTDEYIKCLNPNKIFTSNQLRSESIKLIGELPIHEFGIWIFYPWLNKLVHCLNEEEFIRVRTNRNQYKITCSEYDILKTKSIGIVGLSVGQSIILTIAQERICGEIRIADFDTLELSNLNRIRSGITNLGLKKAYIVAREIAEIDPFLHVKVFEEGITDENIESFFNNDKKLDLCIEVCDGLYTKIDIRKKAKKYGVAVIMNSSDKGTTDIERYDKNSSYPILHGLIDHLNYNDLKKAKTNEEKVPYIFPMLGVDTSTPKLKASMLEIQESINTWPQLASGVVLGGAICTDIARRLLLNELTISGRCTLDLEEVFSNNSFVNPNLKPNLNINKELHSSKEELINIINNNPAFTKTCEKALNSTIDINLINSIIQFGVYAPSGGNSQPWKFLIKGNIVYILYDSVRDNETLNCHYAAGLISIGACLYNMESYCKVKGIHHEILINKDNLLSKLFAAFIIHPEKVTPCLNSDYLDLIRNRMTNRTKIAIGPRFQLSEYLQKSELTHDEKFSLKTISKEEEIETFRHIIGEIDKLFYTHDKCLSNFIDELRWPNDPRVNSGISISSLNLKPSELAGLEVSRDKKVMDYIRLWNKGNSFKKINSIAIMNAAGIGMITTSILNPESFLMGGMYLQNLWIKLSQSKISVQPISISTFLNYRTIHDNSFKTHFKTDEFIVHIKSLKSLFKLSPNEYPVFIFRYFKSNEESERSKRLPIDEISF